MTHKAPPRWATAFAIGQLAALPAFMEVATAHAGPEGAVLHEPIPPDPSEDQAMNMTLEGRLPLRIRTANGDVPAPNPEDLPSASEMVYSSADRDQFNPDRDTRRPDVQGYDDPFTPSTAPFKRLSAFDAVREDYSLYVRDARLTPMGDGVAPTSSDDAFYGDVVVDLAPGRRVRIPSVGPGARVVQARLGVGVRDIPFRILRDGAENWFLDAADVRSAARARLVLQLAIPREAFGGPLRDPSWSELQRVPAPPENVARDAAAVSAVIGVSRQMRPREVVTKLVQYFRGFSESSEPLRPQGSIYLDIALSKRGVCRHRAFAFMVTAESLGVSTRVVINEAHAWVEVDDGVMWRRIDLGGAGRMSPQPKADANRPTYEPPADAFRWPRGAVTGGDMMAGARSGSGSTPANSTSQASADAPPPGPSEATSVMAAHETAAEPVDRAQSLVTLEVTDTGAHRGAPLHVRGTVSADSQPCDHVTVELSLRDPKSRREFALGTAATDDHGAFAGAIVVPASPPLGTYDVIARTPGGARCGAGTN